MVQDVLLSICMQKVTTGMREKGINVDTAVEESEPYCYNTEGDRNSVVR